MIYMEYLIGIILACMIGYWVYKDADKRNSSCPELWGILVALFAIIFLPIYLLFRPDMPKQKSNSTVTEVVAFCPNCGKYYRKPAKFCPNCGIKISK